MTGVQTCALPICQLFDLAAVDHVAVKINHSLGHLQVVDENGKLITVENLEMPKGMVDLYRHMIEGGKIKQLANFDASVLHIFSRDVLERIKDGDSSWEEMVPPEIASIIKLRHFFEYQEMEPPKAIAGKQDNAGDLQNSGLRELLQPVLQR